MANRNSLWRFVIVILDSFKYVLGLLIRLMHSLNSAVLTIQGSGGRGEETEADAVACPTFINICFNSGKDSLSTSLIRHWIGSLWDTYSDPYTFAVGADHLCSDHSRRVLRPFVKLKAYMLCRVKSTFHLECTPVFLKLFYSYTVILMQTKTQVSAFLFRELICATSSKL